MSQSTRRTRKRLAAGTLAGVLAASCVAALAPAASAKDFAQVVNTAGTLAGANVGGAARLQGGNRYATSANVAVATYGSAGGKTDVILASGENFPDGLAAAGLAGAKDTPVLLTRSGDLPIETSGALATLFAGSATKRVHVVGGTAAISAAVRTQLTALGYTLVETYSGVDRIDTAAKVAAGIGAGSIGGIAGKRTAIIATGANYADALAAGGVSFAGKFPILLTDTAALSAAASAAITSLGITQVIVMGGTAAVSAAVRTSLTALGVTLIEMSGVNRSDTAVKLATYADVNLAGLGFDMTSVVLFNGFDTFADGLSAGPHAGKLGASLLPVDDTAVPTEVTSYLAALQATLALVQAIGGTAVISDATLTAAITSSTLASPTATIAASQGQAGFTVVFSAAVDTTDVATAALNNFTITSSNALIAGQVLASNPGATSTYNATTRTLSVIGLDAGLSAGDVISFTPQAAPNSALSNVNAAGSTTVFVLVTSFTVVTDSTAPTVAATAATGATQLLLTFSEPVAGLAAGDFTITGGKTITSVAGCATDAATLKCVVPVSAALALGDQISATAASFTDLSTANSVVGGVIGTASNDSVNPTIVSATVAVANSGTDAATLVDGTPVGTGSLTVSADSSGDTGISVTIAVAAAAAAPVVTYDTTTKIILVTLGTLAGNNGGVGIAALINANTTLAPLVTATGAGQFDPTDSVANTALTGGTTTNSLTVVFSESVAVEIADLLILDLDGNFATVGDQTDLATAAATLAAGVFVAAPAGTITPGVSRVAATGIQDLVGLSITAGSNVAITS